MKLATLLPVLASALACYGQLLQPPASANEMKYLQFLLMKIGSVDQHPNAKTAFEITLVRQFGLNPQEVGVIRSAGQELQSLLQQLRPVVRSMRLDADGNLSAADRATLAGLTAQREQKVQVLANRILSQVRPEVAVRLRVPGSILANRANPAGPGR